MTDIHTSIHGSRFGLTANNALVAQNPRTGQGVLLTSPFHAGVAIAKNTLFDDFNGPLLSTFNFSVFKGSDGSTVNPVIAVSKGGTVALTTASAGASTMAVGGCQLNGALNFEADAGNLVFEAKIKLGSLASESVFVGLTNQATALQMPVNSAGSGNTVTFNAADCVGFLFDTANTAQSFFAVGQANSVPAAVQVLPVAPVVGTYNTLRIEITAAGLANFYIDGINVGSQMVGAVTPTVPLTPVLAIFPRTTAAKTMTADYVYAAQDAV